MINSLYKNQAYKEPKASKLKIDLETTVLLITKQGRMQKLKD